MQKSYRNNRALAVELLRGKWLIHQPETAFPAARDFLLRVSSANTLQESKPVTRMASAQGSVFDLGDGSIPEGPQRVLIVPLHGVLTKYDNCIGCATMEVADILAQFRDDESVAGFILDIDSPGGSANAVMPVIEEIKKIRAAGKPIIAHTDLCCSAAYWIASQCDAIYADNELSEAGSIGAYCELIDDRENKQTGEKHIIVYAPQSTDKNKPYRDALDGKEETLQAELSELVIVFQQQVKAGRPDLDAEAEGVLSGKVFYAPKAVQLGLVNAIAGLDECIEIIFSQIG